MLYCANVEIIIEYTTKMKLPVLAGAAFITLTGRIDECCECTPGMRTIKT